LAIPLKLGPIEQEHLQESYEATGVPRDDLPYSPAFAQLCTSFQDRTFKNADEAQVYHAIIKYVRSSRCAKGKGVEPEEALPGRAEQARMLRTHRPLVRKLQPYTAEFDSARVDFMRRGGAELSPHEFWRLVRIASERTPAKPNGTHELVAVEPLALAAAP